MNTSTSTSTVPYVGVDIAKLTLSVWVAGQRPGVAPAVPASVERVIAALEEELRQIEQAIAAHLAEAPEVKAA